MEEGEKIEFRSWDYQNSCYLKLLPKWVWSAQVLVLGGVPKEKPILATKLPKSWEGIKKKKNLWQWHWQNEEGKNCGNWFVAFYITKIDSLIIITHNK